MKKAHKTFSKFLAILLLVSFVVTPAFVEAIPVPDISSFAKDPTPPVPVSDGAIRQKEVGITIFGITIPGISLDSILITIGREAVDVMGDEIVKWINDTGGDQKGPLFITDPKEFFTNIADEVGGSFIKQVGLSTLCSPFRANITGALALNLQKTNRNKIGDKYDCTITKVSKNVDAFIDGNFSEGGWPAWFELTQRTQNNPYGAILETSADLNFRISSAQGNAKLESEWGKGFLNLRDCAEWDTASETYDEFGNLTGTDQKCVKWGPTKTPGTVIEQQLNKTFNAELDQLNIADEFDEIFGALMGKLMGQVLNKAEGVFSNTGSGWAGSGRGRTSPPNPAGSCRSNTYLAVKGDKVTWTLTTSASQNAIFAWGGDEGLTGTGKTVTWVYNIPSPPAKNAWVYVTDTVMVQGNPQTTTTRVKCNDTGQNLVISKYPQITGECMAIDFFKYTASNGAIKEQIYSVLPGTWMMWYVHNITGGSGKYQQYVWDNGSNPTVKSGDGTGKNIPRPGGTWNVYPTKTPTPILPRWYDLAGNQTVNVQILDTDISYPTPYGEVRCPSDGSKFYVPYW